MSRARNGEPAGTARRVAADNSATPCIIRIVTAGNGIDVAEATYRGQTYRASSRHGCTMVLARQLVAAGAPDGPWRAIGPDGRTWFTGRSLHRLAALTIEDAESGLRWRRWTPRNTVPPSPARRAASGPAAPAVPSAPGSAEAALAP